jgi:class 3 adenylate cyclase
MMRSKSSHYTTSDMSPHSASSRGSGAHGVSACNTVRARKRSMIIRDAAPLDLSLISEDDGETNHSVVGPHRFDTRENHNSSRNSSRLSNNSDAPTNATTGLGSSVSVSGRSFLTAKEAFKPSPGSPTASHARTADLTATILDGVASQSFNSIPRSTRMLSNRESHTANLEAFDRFVAILRSSDRDAQDAPFNQAVWATIRSQLAMFATPLGVTPRWPFEPHEVPPAVLSAFTQRVLKSVSIHPLDVALLSKLADVREYDMIAELLHAAKIGLITVKYVPACVFDDCTTDAASSARAEYIEGLSSRAGCAMCQMPSKSKFTDHIRVIFKLQSDVFYAPTKNSRSHADLAKGSQHAETLLLRVVPAVETATTGFIVKLGDSDSSEPPLPAGRYRMRCPISDTDNYLVVARNATAADAPHTATIRVSELCENRHGELQVPHGRLTLKVHPDTSSFFSLWIMQDPSTLPKHKQTYADFLSLATVACHPTYQRWQPAQRARVLPPLVLKEVVFVSTSVQSPASLPGYLNDWEAYQLARRQFDLVMDTYRRRGRVLQSSADVILAAFSDVQHALDAAAEALSVVSQQCIIPPPPTLAQRFTPAPPQRAAKPTATVASPPQKRHLQLRIGVHAGPAAVVTTQGAQVALEGMTVDIALQLHRLAKPSQLLISTEVMDHSDASQPLAVLVAPNNSGLETTTTAVQGRSFPLCCLRRSELVPCSPNSSDAPVLVSRLQFNGVTA